MQGVYIIWHGGSSARTVRIGQGDIADRLSAHRKDPEILAHSSLGLFATWAAVGRADRDGVEKYLADTLKPIVAERFPEVPSIPVNLPW
jgi:spore maturation protein SpmA